MIYSLDSGAALGCAAGASFVCFLVDFRAAGLLEEAFFDFLRSRFSRRFISISSVRMILM